MSRRYATQWEVLTAIAERLRLKMEGYTEANCFLLDQPIPEHLPVGQECCTISPGGGQFVGSLFTGSAAASVTEDATAVVTPLVRHVRGPESRGRIKLGSAADGLVIRKGQILEALLGDDYDLELKGRPLLRDQITPASAAPPGETTIGQYQMLGLSITFHTPFDWPITQAATFREREG